MGGAIERAAGPYLYNPMNDRHLREGDGGSRRKAAIADRGLGLLNWAESGRLANALSPIRFPPRPVRIEKRWVLTKRRLSELRQRGVDFLKQLVRALIFGRGPRFFKVAFRLRALRLHRGQCAEVEIDERACDAAVAQVSARGRLPKQRRSAAGADSLIPIRVRKFLRTKPGGGFSLLVST